MKTKKAKHSDNQTIHTVLDFANAKESRNISLPEEWEPRDNFDNVGSLIEALQLGRFAPDGKNPSDVMFFLPMTASVRRKWDNLKKWTQTDRDRINLLTVGVSARTLLNIIEFKNLEDGSRGVYCDGSHSITADGDKFIPLGARVCRSCKSQPNGILMSSTVPLGYLKGSESIAAVSAFLLLLDDFTKRAFGWEIPVDIAGSDHANAFVSSFQLVYPSAELYQCYVHAAGTTKPNGGLYQKFCKKSTFCPTAKYDIRLLHLTKTAQAKKVAGSAFMNGWRFHHGEMPAGDHFHEQYLTFPHDGWNYTVTGCPGVYELYLFCDSSFMRTNTKPYCYSACS
jgi:hypothetical protein